MAVGTVAQARKRNLAILVCVVAAWLILDILTKASFSDIAVGETVGGPYLGLFQLTLVHNTGAAWGIFGDSTLLLGIFSLLVCTAAILYLFVLAPRTSIPAAIGLSLVIAGGIGNAIDRLANGYVTDFIATTFIDFPVFNVADIGVTCGVVIFIVALAIEAFAPDGEGEGS